MTRTSTPTLIVIVGLICGALIFAATAEQLWYAPDTEVSVVGIEMEPRVALPEDLPVRLRVPKLDIDAHIQEVGINTQGNMAAPTNFVDAGWYKHGTVPGFVGSAVITGRSEERRVGKECRSRWAPY